MKPMTNSITRRALLPAADVKTVTAALRPFVASLSEAQRRRIPAFLGLRESDFGRAQPLAELWLFEDEQ